MSYEEFRFLYVEDDPPSQNVMRLLLTKLMGYTRLTIFENSENFIERVCALDYIPDVVFLDIHVHPHDGYEMLKMLRSHEAYQKIIIIAMTASVMALDVERLKEAGFNGLIGKPVRQKQFPDLLKKILAGGPTWHIA